LFKHVNLYTEVDTPFIKFIKFIIIHVHMYTQNLRSAKGKTNKSFPSSKNSKIQNEAKCKNFFAKDEGKGKEKEKERG